MLLFRKEFYRFWDIEIYLEKKPELWFSYIYYDGPWHSLKIGFLKMYAGFIRPEDIEEYPHKVTQCLLSPLAWCYYRIAYLHMVSAERHNKRMEKTKKDAGKN